MVDLRDAATELVRAAADDSAPADPKALRGAVERVLESWERATAKSRDQAVRAIGKALEKTHRNGARVLSLALGALVEAGASPEMAWPSIAKALADRLGHATAFATAVIAQAKDDHVDAAIERAGAIVAKKKPREAEAWQSLPACSIAAVACLTRSKKLRKKNEALFHAAWPLSDAIDEVGDLVQALHILDDTSLVVLSPASGKGWRFTIDNIASNLELHVLLAHALLTSAKSGLRGAAPKKEAVRVASGSGPFPKKPPSTVLPLRLLPWTAIQGDGSLLDDGAIPLDGSAWDYPLLADERVVFLAEARESVSVVPTFDALRPAVELVASIPTPDVVKLTVQATLAAGARAAPEPERRKAPKKKSKTTSKKKRAK